MAVETLQLTFLLSDDEETTWLDIHYGNHSISLGARSHHYLTLNLARHRAKDAAKGIILTRQGWVYTDVLIRELGIEQRHLNIQVYRARKQLSEALAVLANDTITLPELPLIERMNGQLRLATEQFSITKGDTVECTAPAEE